MIDLASLEASRSFPYALGVLQARVRKIRRDAFAITNQGSYLAERVRGILESELQTEVYFATVDYVSFDNNTATKTKKTKHRVVLWSRPLMAYIKEITKDNQQVPENFSREQAVEYLRGWFDAVACVTYSPHYLGWADYKMKYPRIVITKNNPSLLSDLKRCLGRLLICSTFGGRQLRIHKRMDVDRVARLELLGDEFKSEILERLIGEAAPIYSR